ncbi:MAG: hypothetical protein IIB38_11415, partial [Candidatus Hydrogenedentes bacterium]|nr:hypothetical protein [Candidatus Hydrogenedentota bacterium]
MAFNTEADNYVRAFSAAANIVASQNTDDDSVKDVAATVQELAVVLWKKQNKFVKANDLQEAPQAASPKSSGASPRSDSAPSGLSPKQRSALGKALDSLGDAVERCGGFVQLVDTSLKRRLFDDCLEFARALVDKPPVAPGDEEAARESAIQLYRFALQCPP